MKNTEINKLLEKYWEAETSLQEEKILSDYFKNGYIASEHLPYKGLFQYYDVASSMKLSDEDTIPQKNETKVFSLRKNFIGIAASLLLLLSAGIFIINGNNSHTYKGKTTIITEEEEALEITKEALAFLSAKLDESSKEITSDVKNMEKVSILK